MVLYVATWFKGYKGLLGSDMGFPSRDRVIFLLLFCHEKGPPYVATRVLLLSQQRSSLCYDRGPPCVAIGVLPVLRQCFVLWRDNVATKGPLSWQRRPRQEVGVATGAWLRPRNFLVAIGNLLCCDREILCCDIVGKAGTIFCHDRVSHARGFLSG